MGETTVQQAVQQAMAHHRAGRWPQAEAAYRILISVDGNNHAHRVNLGVVFAAQRRFIEAADCFSSVLKHEPSPEIHNLLGSVLKDSGKIDSAIISFNDAITMRGNFPEAHFNLGAALQLKGATREAIARYQIAIRLRPGYAAAHNNLGHALCLVEQFQEGINEFKNAIAVQADFAEAHSNLGSALTSLGRHAEALEHIRKSADLLPNSPDVLNNLAIALRGSADLDGSIKALRRAIDLRPNFAEALTNLAAALKDTGLIDESIACYRAAMAIHPDPRTGNGLLFALHHHPDTTPSQLMREHALWDRQFATIHRPARPIHKNDRAPLRRLRVGYVGSLDDSPVGRFMLPLLAAHDREQFEVYCYADATATDPFAGRLRSHASQWRDVISFSDERLAKQINEDKIDILVDLAMHGGRNRLLTFARNPAPVQVTYLAYAGTTGLQTMDYRLSDPYLDPPSSQEKVADRQNYSEETVRLPHSFWCYQPSLELPLPAPPPSSQNGYITFGCLNSSAKINTAVLKTWRGILDSVPGSRFIIHSHPGEHRRRVADALANSAQQLDRVDFVPLLSPKQYFEVYNQIDIALDPFPFTGGTTTCDALWMGVPVVTLSGQTAVSRGGRSILSNVGLREFIAEDPVQYVAIATDLTADSRRLMTLRHQMRNRMKSSPLMDQAGFANGVESSLKMMWRKWCETQ
jgi:predicted O-linked N-acetylglucosamine transferase (SPINDLY family)